jgi:ATP-dependent phosphofructokinase / diphosphate-dependent phosphofructokinase
MTHLHALGEGIMSKKVIGVLTGGGDCPGLNPAIKAVVKKAIESDFDVLGLKEGWLSLVDDQIKPMVLDRDVVRHIDRQGGTILGTSRTNPFKVNNGPDNVKKRMAELGLSSIVAIGGEDTLGVAAKLHDQLSLPVVGIPKTIDRDLSYTDYSLGFESALQVITDSVDCLRSTAESHARIFVVEVMGRHAGHLALRGGISAAASVILIPEYNFNVDRICELLVARKKRGVRYSIVMVAEGAMPEGHDLSLVSQEKDAFGHVRLGGIGHYLATEIENRAKLESRAVVLSHLQRGGKPVAFDRRLGFYFGVAAVEAIIGGHFGKMAALKNGRIVLAPLKEAVKELRVVDVETSYDTRFYRAKQSIIGMLGPVEETLLRSPS